MAHDLWNACFDGNFGSAVSEINACKADNVNPDEHAYDNVTPLYLTCEFNYPRILDELIRAGSDVNKVSRHGVNPLYIASEKGHLDCVKLLIQSGKCDLNGMNEKGFTPLYRLSERGPLDCLEFLLQQQGLDIDKPNSGGFTPLMVAAERNGIDAVKLLLKYGADKNKKSRGGNLAPHFARMGNNNEAAQFIENWVPKPVEYAQSNVAPPDYAEEMKRDAFLPVVSDAFKDKKPDEWDELDVGSWLASLGNAFGDYRQAFLDNGVNGVSLLEDIDQEALIELGVAKKLHRKRLEREVKNLKKQL